ncbi:MAG: hypothetical protein HXY19_06050 [Thermoanaerobaculaceae bacterium]|jgi:hypothetical protein|nr:hypothetical protein [Thermoanaerobaculaceae bacterium]
MSPFLGGSAYGMAGQISEGYTLLTAVQLKRLTLDEMAQLQFELERLARDLRAEQVPLDDIPALQAKNRRLSRITSALQAIQAARARWRHGS